MKTKIIMVSITILLVISFLFAGCSSPPAITPKPSTAPAPAPAPAATTSPAASPKPAPAPVAAPAAKPKTITLRGVGFLPTNALNMQFAHEFAKRVTAQGKGELIVDYIGGPEVIPPPQQWMATRSGAMDIDFGAIAFYGPSLPAANTIHLVDTDPSDWRKSGLYDFMNELHQRIGLFIIGRYMVSAPNNFGMNLFVNKEVKSIADFKGLRMRTGPLVEDFLKALGTIPITMSWPDVYSAASKKVIDGAAASGLEFGPQAFAEMFKYVVYPSFYDHDTVITINLEKWKSLTKQQQDLMLDVATKMEPEIAPKFADVYKQERGKMQGFGMKDIKLADDVAKTYFDLAYSSAWAMAKRDSPPADLEKLKKLIPSSSKYLPAK